jgi:hypothetical protein
MTLSPPNRPSFRAWVDSEPDPGWGLMPLTHITKGVLAEDIVRQDAVMAIERGVVKTRLAYFFYGRPAYRVSGDTAVKIEAVCPFCFVFDPLLLRKAAGINAFDTGAFANRMYKHMLPEEMNVEDFSLGTDETRPNRIISKVFSSREAYFRGDTTVAVSAEEGASPWEFHARAYLNLLASRGRNEPDDRICSIEVVFGDDVPLAGNLKAIIVPHTLWTGTTRAPWLEAINRSGAQVSPYEFTPGRHPEHYHTLMELAVRDLYEGWGIL